MLITEKTPLADYTSWTVGGSADYFCLPTNETELEKALNFARELKIPWTILGGGTNVLVSDEGIEGLVICLRRFSGIQVAEKDGRLVIEAFSGTAKSELLKTFLKNQLEPALFLAGLPGDIGGGIVMNAGVAEQISPREFHEIVDWIEVLKPEGSDFRRQVYRKEDVRWSYRHSQGWQPGIVTRVGLSWKLERDPSILEKVRQANRVRLSKQPLDLPSCGSVFVNPPGHKAAQLIDGLGLKGFQVGGAQVSPKHANFIVNVGGATAKDIRKVIEHVRTTVEAKTGVQLKTEVVFLGR